MEKIIESYPLQWPTGWKRTNSRDRSRFKVSSFAHARDEMYRELSRMGVGSYNVVISSNVPLRKDGLPYSGMAQPKDPGIAVYFSYKKKPMALACDTYTKVEDNLWAICKTIEALRGIERWGASDMMERSFQGFAQIQAPQSQAWYEILEVNERASKDEILAAWKNMARKHHPDVGGSSDMMAKINNAKDQGLAR